MKTLNIDLETFSGENIKNAGLYKYVQSRDFNIILFAYSVDGDTTNVVDLANGEQIPQDVTNALFDPVVIKYAFNAAFEWQCLVRHFNITNPLDWIQQWRCTMIQALYLGYPSSLGDVAEALHLPPTQQKMAEGNRLIKYFCMPCKPSKRNGGRLRNLSHHDVAKWELFKKYNWQDVETEKAVMAVINTYPMPLDEWALWRLDLKINLRGVKVDLELAKNAAYLGEVAKDELLSDTALVTSLDNPNSVSQLLTWLAGKGAVLPNLQKETIEDYLGRMKDDGDEDVVRVLTNRLKTSKTSVKKYIAMLNAAHGEDRVKGLLQFYGANRTGRWAGRLVQVQNLPRNHLDTLGSARLLAKSNNYEMLKMLYGDVLDTLSQLVRTAFIPKSGKTFAVADFSAIEARVIAWLANEQWRIDVFATHGRIYEASASQMFGVPLELIVKGNPEYKLRQKGKVAELALGYGGGVGALIKMKALKMGLTENDLPDIVSRWRSSNKQITALWHTFNSAALAVMADGREVVAKGLTFAREMNPDKGLDLLTIKLPSGRKLYYVNPFISTSNFGSKELRYWGMDQTTKKWKILNTYGGKLVENVVQAIARDCLAVSLKRLDDIGYVIIMHVHDEVVLEVDKNTAPQHLQTALEAMSVPINWAKDLNLSAEGFCTDYYCKD